MKPSIVGSVFLGLALSAAALPTNTTTKAPRAPIIVDNPPKLFEAKLLDKKGSAVRGVVNIWAQSVGVKVHADFWGLPKEQALSTFSREYVYHI